MVGHVLNYAVQPRTLLQPAWITPTYAACFALFHLQGTWLLHRTMIPSADALTHAPAPGITNLAWLPSAAVLQFVNPATPNPLLLLVALLLAILASYVAGITLARLALPPQAPRSRVAVILPAALLWLTWIPVPHGWSIAQQFTALATAIHG